MANTISTLLHGRDNNFNLIRFLAATAVMLDHSFALVAPGQAAGAVIDIGALGIGRLAVDVFFIVSGFLVTRSVMTQPTLVDYAVARFLRLFPALFVVCVATVFVLGPIVTTVSWHDYFTDRRTWLFVPATVSLLTQNHCLPGVFDTLPQPGEINPPLWTLRYETMCYVLLGLFALAGALATRRRVTITLAALLGLYAMVTFATDWREHIAAVTIVCRFVLGFFIGGAFYLYADKVRLNAGIALALAAIAVVSSGTPVQEMAQRLALAYGIIWFALVPAGAIRSFNRLGDYSYGLYILCFPLQQSIVQFDPTIAPGALFALSFPTVLAAAMLSWHLVEHPALRRKAWAGDCVGSLLGTVQQRLAPKPQRALTS